MVSLRVGCSAHFIPLPLLTLKRSVSSAQCGLSNSSDSDLSEVKKNFLTRRDVKAVRQAVFSSEHKYSRVVVMKEQAANGRQYDIMFLLAGETLNLK